MAQKYKETGTRGFFGEELRLQKPSKQGDSLERLNNIIDWGLLGHILLKTENTKKEEQCRSKTLLTSFNI